MNAVVKNVYSRLSELALSWLDTDNGEIVETQLKQRVTERHIEDGLEAYAVFMVKSEDKVERANARAIAREQPHKIFADDKFCDRVTQFGMYGEVVYE